jgi:putative modified peptide
MLEDDQRIQISMTPQQAEELLGKLAEDDDFRQELEADPERVLAEYGIQVPPGQLEGQAVLPPKEEVQDARSKMETGELYPEGLRPPIFRIFMQLLIFIRIFREPR